MKTGRNFPAKGPSMTIFNNLALDIMHHTGTLQQTRSSQNASSWVGWRYFKFVFNPPRSPGSTIECFVVFFSWRKVHFHNEWQDSSFGGWERLRRALCRGWKNKTEKRNQIVSREQSKGITMYFNLKKPKKTKVRLEQSKCSSALRANYS